METIEVVLKGIKKEGEKNGKPWKVFNYTLKDGRMASGFVDLPADKPCEVEMEEHPQYGWQVVKYNDPTKPKGNTRQGGGGMSDKQAALAAATLLTAHDKVPLRSIFEMAEKMEAYLKGTTPTAKDMQAADNKH